MGIVILLVLGLLQGALVTVGGRLLMRPGLAVWREALRDRKWRWLRWPFCVSPLLILLLGSVALSAIFGPVLVWPRNFGWLALPGIFGLFSLPALAACWCCLPADDREKFDYMRGMVCAWSISIVNLVPAAFAM